MFARLRLNFFSKTCDEGILHLESRSTGGRTPPVAKFFKKIGFGFFAIVRFDSRQNNFNVFAVELGLKRRGAIVNAEPFHAPVNFKRAPFAWVGTLAVRMGGSARSIHGE